MEVRGIIFGAVVLISIICHSYGSENEEEQPKFINLESDTKEKHIKPDLVQVVDWPIVVNRQRCKRSNEKWYSCLPTCPITCENIQKPCRDIDYGCQSGCDCRSGYARLTNNGPCVPVRNCPAVDYETCDRNEIYKTCGMRCDEICDTSECRDRSRCRSGCFCKRGYVRIHGRCVSDDHCNVPDDKCGRNEEYQSCGYSCQDSCDDDLCHRVRQPCKEGCYCKRNFKRIGGECVSQNKCYEGEDQDSRCPKNSHWGCGNVCSDSCGKETMRCSNECRDRCICNYNFALIDGECKKKSECRSDDDDIDHDIGRPCGQNKIISDCGNSCLQKCPNLGLVCPLFCQMGCFCEPNFYEINGKCRPLEEC